MCMLPVLSQQLPTRLQGACGGQRLCSAAARPERLRSKQLQLPEVQQAGMAIGCNKSLPDSAHDIQLGGSERMATHPSV